MIGVIYHAWLGSATELKRADGVLRSGVKVGSHSEAELFPGIELS